MLIPSRLRDGIRASGLWLLSLAACFAYTSPVTAQDLSVELAEIGHPGMRAGFDQERRLGGIAGAETWLPCEVVLANRGAQELRGRVVVYETSFTRRSPMRYQRPITLAPGARKRVSFPLRWKDSSNFRVRFEDEEGKRVPHAGSPVIPEPLSRDPGAVVLFVRDPRRAQGTLDALQPLDSLTVRADYYKRFTAQSMSVGNLPEHGVLYDGFDVVVLDDVPLQELSAAQQSSLLQFVATGGDLVVSLSKEGATAQASRLFEVLPGKPGPVIATAYAHDLDAFRKPGPSALSAPKQTFLTFAPVPGARTWGKQRVVVHKRYEEGRIILAGFRLGTIPDVDHLRLLGQVLRTQARPRLLTSLGHQGRRAMRHLSGALGNATRKAVPPLRVLVIFVCGYLVVGLLLPFTIGRALRRVELAWPLVLAGVLVATIAVFGLGNRYEQDSRIVGATIFVGGEEAGPRERVGYWSVFSREGGALPLELSRPALPFASRESSREAVSWSDEREVTLQTHPQESMLLQTVETIELAHGGLDFRARGTGERASLVCRSSLKPTRAWAFDRAGRPARLDYDEGSSELVATELQGLLSAAKAFAADLARRRRRPTLLYTLSPDEALSSLPEHHLALGILGASAERVVPRGDLLPALLEEVPNPKRTGPWREYQLEVEIPANTVIRAIRLSTYSIVRSRLRRPPNRKPPPRNPTALPQVFDPSSGEWRALAAARSFAVTSPLGVARVRIRVSSEEMAQSHVELVLQKDKR